MNRSAMGQLILSRVRLYVREPEALFWSYGFPLIMVLILGIAFRERGPEKIHFDLVDGPQAKSAAAKLGESDIVEVNLVDADAAATRLRKGKVVLVAEIMDDGKCVYRFDPVNPESRAARLAVDDALQRALGRQDMLQASDEKIEAPGSRYVDFLVPGLIGMNIMGSGLWGVGFMLADMRVRNLLKRLLATPMRRSDFLLSMIGMRVLFFIPEMSVLLLVSYLVFDIPFEGSLAAVCFMGALGAVAFAGLGLLTACRARRIETVAGLMNLVMMPMWLTSGIFFSSERFPDITQPLIQLLPLTQLIDALRAIMLEGESLASQYVAILALIAWSVLAFVLAIRWFRWNE